MEFLLSAFNTISHEKAQRTSEIMSWTRATMYYFVYYINTWQEKSASLVNEKKVTEWRESRVTYQHQIGDLKHNGYGYGFSQGWISLSSSFLEVDCLYWNAVNDYFTTDSGMRIRAATKDDFPDPVRPVTPIFAPPSILSLMLFNTCGPPG